MILNQLIIPQPPRQMPPPPQALVLMTISSDRFVRGNKSKTERWDQIPSVRRRLTTLKQWQITRKIWLLQSLEKRAWRTISHNPQLQERRSWVKWPQSKKKNLSISECYLLCNNNTVWNLIESNMKNSALLSPKLWLVRWLESKRSCYRSGALSLGKIVRTKSKMLWKYI